MGGALVQQGNVQHRTVVAALNAHRDIVAGAVHRLHGDGVAERITHTKGLNIALAVIGAVLPVAVDINGQGTVITVEGGTGELIIPGIYIGDSQRSGDGQHGTAVFSNVASVSASDHCRGIFRYIGPNNLTAAFRRGRKRSALFTIPTAVINRCINGLIAIIITVIITRNDRRSAHRGSGWLGTTIITSLGAA